MNGCPYVNNPTVCGLTETDGTATVAYCKACSEIAFRRASGPWNRAFSRYCTQSGDKLEKPAVWGMASGNPHRTGTLPQRPAVDELKREHGFSTGVAPIGEIQTDADLPAPLAIDGVIVVPNPEQKWLDAYTIADFSEPLKLKWRIAYEEALTYGSTPIYHGLHLYYVGSDRLMRQPVTGGEAAPVEIAGVDPAHLRSNPMCAPLKCYVNGTPTLVAGLEQGPLLFNLSKNSGRYNDHQFFSENTVLSPTQCGDRIVFTALEGKILSLKIGPDIQTKPHSYQNVYFSAPVSVNGQVYFETVSPNGDRSLACFNPNTGGLSKIGDMDSEQEANFDYRLKLFTHPPLTDGKRLFFTDRFGEQLYVYDSKQGLFRPRALPQNNSHHRLVPHLSIVVNHQIYSVTTTGLTIFPLTNINAAQHQSLAMGRPTNPSPLTRPIRYGNKLFVLCRDRLLCLEC